MEPGKALDAVGALMRERQKYEGWLDALVARRESAPSRVFDRVHADYVARLEAVMRQLGEHAPVLAEQAGALDERLATLVAQEGELRDQRAEAELRSVVGELSPEEWEAFARDSEEALTAVGSEQGRLRHELAQVRELLSAATTPARALTPIESTPVTEAPAAPAEPEAMSPAAPEPEANPITGSASDSLQADHAEGGTGERTPLAEEGGAAPAVVVGAAEAGSAGPPGSPFDELAFLESVADTSSATQAGTSQPDSPPSAPEEPHDPSLGVVVQDGTPPSALTGLQQGGTPMAGNVTGNQPIVLRAETAQSKTLKCTDCGALNYPTEWYCERCGAELASL